MKNSSASFPRLTAIATALMVVGCASISASPEEIVRSRATASWQARMANDFERAYQFMPPSFSAVTPLANYKSGFGGAVQWKSAEVTSVQCPTTDKCLARIKIEAKALIGAGVGDRAPIVTHFDETWIRENGQWWLFPTL